MPENPTNRVEKNKVQVPAELKGLDDLLIKSYRELEAAYEPNIEKNKKIEERNIQNGERPNTNTIEKETWLKDGYGTMEIDTWIDLNRDKLEDGSWTIATLMKTGDGDIKILLKHYTGYESDYTLQRVEMIPSDPNKLSDSEKEIILQIANKVRVETERAKSRYELYSLKSSK